MVSSIVLPWLLAELEVETFYCWVGGDNLPKVKTREDFKFGEVDYSFGGSSSWSCHDTLGFMRMLSNNLV